MVLLALLATFVLMEILLRIFDPLGIAYFSEARRYFSNMVPDERFCYTHRAGYWNRLQGADVSINSRGLRGPEFQVPKPPGRKRLLILGDSVVFGWGAPQSVIFPARLQEILDEDAKDIEVIAAGVGSWNTRTEYEYLKSEAILFAPDVVTLVVVSNDVDPHRTGHTDVEKQRLFAQTDRELGNALTRTLRKLWHWSAVRSYALGYVQYFLKVRSMSDSLAAATTDSPRWEDARLALDGIMALCRERNIKLVVYLYATRDAAAGSSVLRLYRDHLESKELPVYYMPQALFDPAYRNSRMDSHVNAQGHEIMTQTIYDTVEPLLK